MYRQKGFTLIELVVVIVILGLLAATALPKFVDLTTDARVASVQGVAGGLRAGAALAHAGWLVNGETSPVTVEGGTVAVNTSGYPTKASISSMVANPDGWSSIDTSGATTAKYGPDLTGKPGCNATYDETDGTVAVNASAGSC